MADPKYREGELVVLARQHSVRRTHGISREEFGRTFTILKQLGDRDGEHAYYIQVSPDLQHALPHWHVLESMLEPALPKQVVPAGKKQVRVYRCFYGKQTSFIWGQYDETMTPTDLMVAVMCGKSGAPDLKLKSGDDMVMIKAEYHGMDCLMMDVTGGEHG